VFDTSVPPVAVAAAATLLDGLIKAAVALLDGLIEAAMETRTDEQFYFSGTSKHAHAIARIY
jgi:hypothetical protein